MDQATECYQRFLKGDESALVELIRDHRDGLMLYINGFVSNLSVADVGGVVHMSHMSIADEDYWLDPGVSPAKKFALDHSDILKGYYAPYGGVNVSWRLPDQ